MYNVQVNHKMQQKYPWKIVRKFLGSYLVVHGEGRRGWARHERVLSVHLDGGLLSDGHLQLEVLCRVVVVFESEGLHVACPSGCWLRTEQVKSEEPLSSSFSALGSAQKSGAPRRHWPFAAPPRSSRGGPAESRCCWWAFSEISSASLAADLLSILSSRPPRSASPFYYCSRKNADFVFHPLARDHDD